MTCEMVHKVTIRLISFSANHLHDNQSRFKRSDLKTHYLDVLNNAQLTSLWFLKIDTPHTQLTSWWFVKIDTPHT